MNDLWESLVGIIRVGIIRHFRLVDNTVITLYIGKRFRGKTKEGELTIHISKVFYRVISLFAAHAFLTSIVVNCVNAQAYWTKSESNPVMPYSSNNVNDPSGYTHLLEPTVLYDSVAQKFTMWFTSSTSQYGSKFSVSQAESQNGTDWYLYARNPVLLAGPAGSFDEGGIDASRAVYTGSEYQLFYTGVSQGKYSIGGAFSSDGVAWHKFAGNPVLTTGTAGSWDSKNIGWCDVVLKDGVYYLWYNGTSGDHWEGIGLATSTDGKVWTKYAGNPVFVKNTSGWDGYEVATPAVVFCKGLFQMIYQGMASTGPSAFGWAYSEDGIHWMRGSNEPILTAGATWEATLGTADVLFVNNRFHMWYSGRSGATQHWQIGYAWSDDGPASVLNSTKPVPHEFTLEQNYPNPFNPSTTIRYSLPHRAIVTLTIFDVLGGRVALLKNGEQEAGYHEVVFHATGLPSGVYFYRMQVRPLDSAIGRDSKGRAGEFAQTGKLLLLQ